LKKKKKKKKTKLLLPLLLLLLLFRLRCLRGFHLRGSQSEDPREARRRSRSLRAWRGGHARREEEEKTTTTRRKRALARAAAAATTTATTAKRGCSRSRFLQLRFLLRAPQTRAPGSWERRR
jgi:hypothetical protein